MRQGHQRGRAVGAELKGARGIVIAGMGGSGTAGRLVWDVCHATATVPLMLVQDHRLPGCVGPGWTVVAVSYSGETEETLAVARQARAAGARVVAVTTGGTLGDEAGVVVRQPSGFHPRAAVGFMWMALLGALEAGKIIPSVLLDDVVSAVKSVDRACAPGARDNPAEALARAVESQIPCIYATPGMAAIATFVASLLNENGKRLAFVQRIPECNHNDLVGWSGDPLRSEFVAVMLSDEAPDSEMGRRVAFMRQRYQEWGVAWQEPEVLRPGDLREAIVAQARLIQWAEYVSLYVAARSGVDPGQVAVIDALKGTLRESELPVTAAPIAP